jgi:hypothetical protein
MTDFDRIADDMQKGINRLTSSIFPDSGAGTGSIAVEVHGLISALAMLQSTCEWCKGHAEGRRMYGQPTQDKGGVSDGFSN